ncbi:MAG: hypothetical protein LBD72_02385 [Puniceicoccales bacterium]|nr:hypothetical protein [Puniceicoccales bacterium]
MSLVILLSRDPAIAVSVSSGSSEYEFAVCSRNGAHLDGKGELGVNCIELAKTINTLSDVSVTHECARILCATIGADVSLAIVAIGHQCNLHLLQALGIAAQTYFTAVLAGVNEVGNLANIVNDAIDNAVAEAQNQHKVNTLKFIL